MKPIDIENLILRSLQNTHGATLARIHRMLAPAHGKGPVWRQVANSVYRLERQGLLHIIGDELVGDHTQPLFGLSQAGMLEARRVASLHPGVLSVPQAAEEAGHA